MHSLRTFILVLIFSVWTLAANHDSQSQCLWQDRADCQADNWDGEYDCLREINSLSEVLDCVEADENGAIKDPICRPDNTYPDNSDSSAYRYESAANRYCTSPRTLIIETWKKYLNKIEKRNSPILGQLRSCPLDDPNYHNCLCYYGVKPQHLQILVPNFRVYYEEDLKSGLMCNKNIPRAVPEEVARSMPLVKRDDTEWTAACPNCDFDITPDGLPVYNDEDGLYTGSYPLPTHDSFIQDGRAVKRCYVHPEEPVEVSCTGWWLDTPVTSTQEVDVPTVTYSAYYDYDDSALTASSAPPVASLPSTSMAYTGSIGFDPTNPAMPTSTSSAGSSAKTGLSASILTLFPMFAILCILLL